MAALPFRFTGEEALLTKAAAPMSGADADADQTATDADAEADAQARAEAEAESSRVNSVLGLSTAPAPARRELTFRALAVGLAIGAVLAAGNVYTGLKAGFIDGGAVTAALLSFTFFATFKRLARIPFGPFENNVAQTAASSAAVMAYVCGMMGPMPALNLMGTSTPAWALWAWGLALAVTGLAMGVFLRRKLVVEDALPFPTGTATAALITAVHGERGDAGRRTRYLVWAALIAGLVTWLRDGRLTLVPQAFYLPLSVAGLSAASLTLGVASSPLMAATGIFIGLRGSLSLLLGGILAWAVVAPVVVKAGWTADASYATLTGWLVWPALGMMMSSAAVPLILEWRTIARVAARTVRDTRTSFFGFGGAPKPGVAAGPTPLPPRRRRAVKVVGISAVALASAALAWIGWRAFHFSPLLTCAALVVSMVLSVICARAAGETDIAPVGNFGTLTQILFAGAGPSASLLSGAIVAANATEVSQTMWTFKAGHSLRASLRSQIIAHMLGAIVGSVVVVPAYFLIVRAYPLGSERMPAAAALSWRATAVALTDGLSGLPPHALQAAAAAFALGTILSLLARTRFRNYVPSAVGVGTAMITPVSLWVAAVVGAGAVVLARKQRPDLADGEVSALAAGLLAGESILVVLIAAWAAWAG